MSLLSKDENHAVISGHSVSICAEVQTNFSTFFYTTCHLGESFYYFPLPTD